MEDLPAEVLDTITFYCDQNDVVNLAAAVPKLARFIVPRLYADICVECTGPCTSTSNSSRITTLSKLKQFLHAVVSGSVGCLVRRFKCISNVPASDSTLRALFSTAFVHLTNLEELYWYACPELSLDVLSLLPLSAKSNLKVLDVDLAVRPWQAYPPLKLPALRTLSVRPFLQQEFLVWLREVVDSCPYLEKLHLARYLSGHRHNEIKGVHVPQAFLSGLPYRWSLKHLGLLNTVMDSKDIDCLHRAIDLQHLESLSLTGSDEGSASVLESLVCKTPKLCSLELDWSGGSKQLDAFLSKTKLESLFICIRHDPSNVLRAVSRQSNLKTLRIRTTCEFRVQDFASLSSLNQLVTLEIPFSFESATWKHVQGLQNLCNLKLSYQGDEDGYVPPLRYTKVLGALRVHPCLEQVEINGHLYRFKPCVGCH